MESAPSTQRPNISRRGRNPDNVKFGPGGRVTQEDKVVDPVTGEIRIVRRKGNLGILNQRGEVILSPQTSATKQTLESKPSNPPESKNTEESQPNVSEPESAIIQAQENQSQTRPLSETEIPTTPSNEPEVKPVTDNSTDQSILSQIENSRTSEEIGSVINELDQSLTEAKKALKDAEQEIDPKFQLLTKLEKKERINQIEVNLRRLESLKRIAITKGAQASNASTLNPEIQKHQDTFNATTVERTFLANLPENELLEERRLLEARLRQDYPLISKEEIQTRKEEFARRIALIDEILQQSKQPQSTKTTEQPQVINNPAIQTEPQSQNRPGFVSIYETPEEAAARKRRIQEEIGDMNQLKKDGSKFNYAAFAYRDPNSTKPITDIVNPVIEPQPTPTPVIPQTPEPVPTPEKAPFTYVGKEESPKVTKPEETKPEEEQPKTEGPFVIDALIQQGTQAELYSAKIEQVRNRGDEVEAANMGSYVNYKTWRERFVFALRNVPRAIRNGFQRARAEIEKNRQLSEQGALDVIFGNRSIEEARKLQDQIAEEGAAILTNDMLQAAAAGLKFDKVYESLDGDPEFEKAKAELTNLIKKYSVQDKATKTYPTRDDFEKEKAPIVEKIMALAKESGDKDALRETIDGFWVNVEKLRAKNLSVEKIADLEIILNLKIARASFLRKTEIQRNLSNELAQTLRDTKYLRWMPVKYRDAISVLIPAIAAGASKMSTNPISTFLTFGVAPLSAGVVSGAIEKKRKLDETDTTRRILARSLAAGGDPREILRKYNPTEIANSVNQVNINQLYSDINFALRDLDAPTDDVNENNQRARLLLQNLARYMSLTDLSTKEKFDYLSASSEESLIEGKQKTAQLALEVRNRLAELAKAGKISLNINNEFRDSFTKNSENLTQATQINKELFEAARGRISTISAARKGGQAAVYSALFGFLAVGAEEVVEHGTNFSAIVDDFSSRIMGDIVDPASIQYQNLLERMGYSPETTPTQVLTDLNHTFPEGKVPDAAQVEYTNTTNPATVDEVLSSNLSDRQIKGWLYDKTGNITEPHHGLTADSCDPTEVASVEKLTASEILQNPDKYPDEYADVLRNGAYTYTEGSYKTVELNGGEAWNYLLTESEVVDKSRLFSIGDPVDQVEAMNTLTHSYWQDANQDVLNINGRDWVRGPENEFAGHTMQTLEDGRVVQVRNILPFNDFLADKVESGEFDVMVYLKDGNVVRVPSEYITTTANGVQVDFTKVPGIVGEIWESENLGLVEAIRYGYQTDSGSHALVSTIPMGGAEGDLSIIDQEWIPGDKVERTFEVPLLEDCPEPDPVPPVPTPEEEPEGIITPVVLFGPGSSGKEERYDFKGTVNPENGVISNERAFKLNKEPKVTLEPTKLLVTAASPEFTNDPFLHGNLGILDRLSKASVQAAAILEMLNENDKKLNDAINDSKATLITNLSILKEKINTLIKKDAKYEFLLKDRAHLETIIIALKISKVNSEKHRDILQHKLKQFVSQYLGQFYKNPTQQVPKVNQVEAIVPPRSTETNTKTEVDTKKTVKLETEMSLEESAMVLSSEIELLIEDLKNNKNLNKVFKEFGKRVDKTFPTGDIFYKSTHHEAIKKLFHAYDLSNEKGLDIDEVVDIDGNPVTGDTINQKFITLLKEVVSDLRKSQSSVKGTTTLPTGPSGAVGPGGSTETTTAASTITTSLNPSELAASSKTAVEATKKTPEITKDSRELTLEIERNIQAQPQSIRDIFSETKSLEVFKVFKKIGNYEYLFVDSPNVANLIPCLVREEGSSKWAYRLFRFSESDNQFKSYPGNRSDGNIRKGEEENPRHHYVQSAKLSPEIYKILEQISSNAIQSPGFVPQEYIPMEGNQKYAEEDDFKETYYDPLNPTLKYEMEKSTKEEKAIHYLYRSFKKGLEFARVSEGINKQLGILKPYNTYLINQIITEYNRLLQNSQNVQDFQNFSLFQMLDPKFKNTELRNFAVNLQTLVYSLNEERQKNYRLSCEPNFDTDKPIKSYKKGDIQIEEFQAKTPEGDDLTFCMALDQEGRVYIDNIYSNPPEFTSYGTYKNIVNFGNIVYKPEDYDSQTIAIDPKFLRKGPYYTDIADHLALIPVVKRYREHLRSRGVSIRKTREEESTSKTV